MDAFEQFQRDFREGRVDLPRLSSFLSDVLRQLHQTQTQFQVSQVRGQDTQQQLKTAENRIAELEKKLGGPPTPRLDQPYSPRAEEKRQRAKDGKKTDKSKGGRRRHDDKAHLVARTEQVFPESVPPERLGVPVGAIA